MGWRGLLLDVGGVLQVGGAAVPGAAEAVAQLRARGIGVRLLSNTTSRSRQGLAEQLRGLGLPVAAEEILTPVGATAAYLRRVGGSSLFLVSGEARADLADLPEDRQHPQHVVVGDTDDAFSREALNRAFRALRAGADLVAMARNRWYATAQGPAVDIGAVVAALEYCAGVTATLIGKPAPEFFLAGVAALGLPASAVAMVGDDPESDVLGAQAAGLAGIWVDAIGRWPVQLPGGPDAIIPSVTALPGLLAEEGDPPSRAGR